MAWFKQRPIYLDYAAATPVRREVLAAMQPFWTEKFGNPGSIHFGGMKALVALNDARYKVARTLKLRTDDIVFTSGGTESNNLAILGAVKAMLAAGVDANDIEIISSPLEHPSIKEALEIAKREGVRVTLVPIGEDGKVILPEFKKLLSPRTRLVTLAYANSETGVVEDIGKIARVIRAYEKENGLTVLFHVDACQAPRWLPCGFDTLAVDMMSLDAGKCEGPKGVGILAKRPRVQLLPIVGGGSQEAGLRPGTEPVPLVVGAAESLVLAQAECAKLADKVAKRRDYFISLLREMPNAIVNGSLTDRLANNVNISIPGVDTEFLVVALSAAGIAASTKSACSGAGSGVSQVVMSMTRDHERSSTTVRFTLSPDTKKKDLAYAVRIIKEHLDRSVLPG